MELYFCLHLTSSEHDIVEHQLSRACERLGAKLSYYRKLKGGHEPMFREAKLTGDRSAVMAVKDWMKREKIDQGVREKTFQKGDG